MQRFFLRLVFVTLILAAVPFVPAVMLEVGDDKPFLRIEDAAAKAKPGDEIVVHPKIDGSPYRQPALLLRTAKLTIRAADTTKLISLDGSGFVYSGVGSVPRAIIQFEPEANGCTLDGFRLFNARNESFNGAAVRINQANDITIRNCVMSACDMGIMSNGEAAKESGARQLIEHCTIRDNGTKSDPGYNHNLYLGGTSVTVQNCNIFGAVTGNNLKSRAHRNFIVDNCIHDSANREIDLVDEAGNTDIPGSDSFLIGNVITKAPRCIGNKSVIHFGRDGKAAHNGTVWLVGNIIQTPFISPVVDISSGKGAVFVNNVIADAGAGQKGVLVKRSSPNMTVSGQGNDIPQRFVVRMPQDGERLPIEWELPLSLPKELLPFLKRR